MKDNLQQQSAHPQTGICIVCGRRTSIHQLMPVEMIRVAIVAMIKNALPDWDEKGSICLSDLNFYRSLYVEEALKKQKGEISALDRRVLKGLQENEIIAQNINTAFDRQLTIGERVADQVASFGGSWRFISLFAGIILVWIAVNAFVLLN
ncbi:MAG: hypothetical protein U1C97_03435, partial [Candidatus Gracilibacteria bacterium]|nr:hypothetical protein [Candidatus Gracilibacteria bacterium]